MTGRDAGGLACRQQKNAAGTQPLQAKKFVWRVVFFVTESPDSFCVNKMKKSIDKMKGFVYDIYCCESNC